MEKTMLAPSGGRVSRLVRRCAEGIEYWLDEKLFTEEQITKMTRAAAIHPIPSSLFEFAAQTFSGLTSKRGEPEPSEEIGKVEVGRLVRARAEGVERLAGKKLFTEEQLAEVAKMDKMEQVDYFGLSYSLPGYVTHAFDNTTGKMAEPESPADMHQGACAPITPDETYDAVECPGAGGGRAIKFRRYAKTALESVPPSHKNIIEAIRTLQHAAWENSKAHGWNEAVDNPASALMMITREVSELAEEERDASSGESTKIPGFSKKEEEAADIAIRLLSYCGARNMRLGAAICAKHEFNKTRPYRHGGKLF